MRGTPHSTQTVIFGIFFLAEILLAASLSADGITAIDSRLVQERAIFAAKSIDARLSAANAEVLSKKPALNHKGYNDFPVSPRSSFRRCLNNDLRACFADIKLAQEFPDPIHPQLILDQIVAGENEDFFGSQGHMDLKSLEEKIGYLDELLTDNDFNLTDRIFTLLQKPGENDAASLKRWLDRVRKLVGEDFLGSEQRMSIPKQSECMQTLFLVKVIMNSQHVTKIAEQSPDIYQEISRFIRNDLVTALQKYSRRRFIQDSNLRDLSLPVLALVRSFGLNELANEKVGVTSQTEFTKFARGHAKGLADLVQVIDSNSADSEMARRAIGKIIDYRTKSFYIGSNEIREKGTLPCHAHKELETILHHAKFFGDRGHLESKVYENRSEILEQLFNSSEAKETRDYLIALKQPEQWLEYFNHVVFSNDKDDKTSSVVEAINNKAILPIHLKNLFLARCILSHGAFDTTPELRGGRDQFVNTWLQIGPKLAFSTFKAAPSKWYRVDRAFIEVSKMIPELDLVSLSIPSYLEYNNQRKEYEKAIRSIPRDFASLSEPDTNYLLDNEIGLFESDYVYRTGKFNKRLNPLLTKRVNAKLEAILAYRNSQFTPPDLRNRRLQTGTPIRELMVKNRHYPDLPPSNPQLQDLLQGLEGLGGLGQLFDSDPLRYEYRENALDAIASNNELQLGDTLFKLAIDAGVEHPTIEEKAVAARKWLNYLRRTQSVARFHSTPEELSNAIHGAYISRLVIQSDEFIDTVMRSQEYAVGSTEDVGTLLEGTFSNQVRIMSNVLSAVDPSSALNKDIDHVKNRWYKMKAWHTESIKWMETVVADPLLMSEVVRVRGLNSTATAYSKIAPAIAELEKTLNQIEPRVVASRHAESHEELFKPMDLANLIIGKLVTLENDNIGRSKTYEPTSVEFSQSEITNDMESLGRQVTDDLYTDIRDSVSQAGFNDLSKVNTLAQFPEITRAYYQNATFTSPSEDAATHELIITRIKGAIAKAKGTIEAEQTTDLGVLEDLSLRASRADRIFFAGDPRRYSLLIDPSFLLHEWNNRHKIDTIAEFRTLETRAQAQTALYRHRKERVRLEKARAAVANQREELDSRLKHARTWAETNNMNFDPDAVIDEMLVMENKITSLEDQITTSQQTEEKYRQHHFYLAKQLHNFRVGQSQFNRDKQRELLLANVEVEAAQTAAPKYTPPKPQPAYTPPAKKYTPPKKQYTPPRRQYQPPQQTRPPSSNQRRGFISRLFGRR